MPLAGPEEEIFQIQKHHGVTSEIDNGQSDDKVFVN